VKSSHRRATSISVVLLLLACAALVALAYSAPQAGAFSRWQHDGADACASCHSPGASDASCTTCHNGFRSYPGRACWSCHEPGAETDDLSVPSSACSQDCHLYYPPLKSYVTPYAHGTDPHLGATGFGPGCTDCHATSSLGGANGSPHHTGATTPAPTCRDCHDGSLASAQVSHYGVACTRCHEGMNIPPVPATCTRCHAASTFGSADCRGCHARAIHDTTPSATACTSCHPGYQRHGGRQSCAGCHTNEAKVHHRNVAVATKSCRSCHAKGHARRAVANSRCASCHRGTGSGPAARAVHSSRVSKRYVCSTCHSKALHARAQGSGITSCRRCHAGRFHRAQPRPGNSVCLSCHAPARFHAASFRCATCHRSAIHSAQPDRRPVRLTT